MLYKTFNASPSSLSITNLSKEPIKIFGEKKNMNPNHHDYFLKKGVVETMIIFEI